MSLYACDLYKDRKLIDDNCVCGYDEPMGAFFFRSGEEDENSVPRIWLGREFFEYKTFSDLLMAFHDRLKMRVWKNDILDLKKRIS
jgi:hypothetical protein